MQNYTYNPDTFIKDFTVDFLNNQLGDISQVLYEAKRFEPILPKRPVKPILKIQHTLDEVNLYASSLEKYDLEMRDYNDVHSQYLENKSHYYTTIEMFIKLHSSLSTIPNQYRDKVYKYAYNEGHSNGFYEVYLKIESIVDEIFN